jgi:NAD(P)-dependent dehydrogenase (short-subunit alcohol dehydrogenase family)
VSRTGRGARATAAAAVGLALGACAAAGTALLLYTGQGFLRAAGLLIASTILAVGAGMWAGAPDGAAARPIATRTRWMLTVLALTAGGLFTAFWAAREPVRELATGGALAVLLVLAVPAYAVGALLAGLHARDRARLPRLAPGAVATAAVAGTAFGVLLATAVLIQTFEPAGIFYGAAVLLAAASLLDRGPVLRPSGHGEISMTDHVTLITGVGDRGQLGFAVARRFLDAGAHVVITARGAGIDELAAELGPSSDIVAVQADLLDDADVTRLIETVRERFGRLDSLVNIAGGLSVTATIEETEPEQWRSELERNAETALRTSRAALPLLRDAHGAIINFAAPAGERAVGGLGAYSAAKAAVIALTRALALEEKIHGVRVNAIAPGIMDTDQNREQMETSRFVTREEVADVVLFLAADTARGISGETVHVAGATLR